MALASNPFTLSVTAAGTGTALEQRAQNMAVGEWRTLTTNNFAGMLLPHDKTFPPVGWSPIVEFTDKMCRNPITKSVFILGCSRAGQPADPAPYQCATTGSPDAGFVQYDEITNTWFEMPAISVCSAPHNYNQACINESTGDYYYFENSGVTIPHFHKFPACAFGNNPVSQTYYLGTGGVFTGAVEWFPERNSIALADAGNGFTGAGRALRLLAAPGTGAWTSLSIPDEWGGAKYMTFIHYSPIHHCIYFGGGENYPTVLYKLAATGGVVSCAASPIGLGVGGQFAPRMVIDPVTGNLLVIATTAGGHVYSFNGTSWTTHGTHPLGSTGTVLCPNRSANVVMAADFDTNAVYLYRHA